MRHHLTRLYRDERGMSFVFVAMGFIAFLSATTLAIDVGMFMTARSQAQNSADAGALAGATALAVNSFTDHTASGPAVQSAVTAAQDNQVIAQTVSVGPSDVQFLNNPTSGVQNRVKVTVYRSAARSNPIPTLMGRFFGVSQVDVLATATAEASPANTETCLKPFTIPDKFIDNHDPGGWFPGATFNPNSDSYIGPSDPVNYTGFNSDRDKGLEMILKANNTSLVTSSFYNPYDLPGSIGATTTATTSRGATPRACILETRCHQKTATWLDRPSKAWTRSSRSTRMRRGMTLASAWKAANTPMAAVRARS